jgi:hypothetical protein
MTITTDTRAEYVKGLRALADLLEQHDELPLPYQGGKHSPMSLTFLSDDDPKGRLAAAARAMPGRLDKQVRESAEYGNYFDLRCRLDGLHIKLTAYRDAVCERVVVGTREVTREVVVPVKTVTETVTETVEDIRWECRPLLAPDTEAVPA